MQGKNKLFYLTLMITISIAVIAVDSVIPAIPLLIEAYNADPSLGQLTIGCYLGGYALAQIPTGLAADRYGRKPVFIFGMVMFTLMSAATLLTENIEHLLIIRFIQGCAGAVGAVLPRAIIRDTHKGEELDRIMTIIVTAVAVAAMIAPIAGTLLVIYFSWIAPFVLNVIVGIVCIFLIIISIKETHQPNRDQHILEQAAQSTKEFFSIPAVVWSTGLVGFTFFAYFSIATGLGSILVDYYQFSPDVIGWGFGFAVAFYMVSAQTCRIAIRKNSPLQLIYFGSWFFLLSLFLSISGAIVWWWSGYLPLIMFAAVICTYLIGMGFMFATGTAITTPRVKTTSKLKGVCW